MSRCSQDSPYKYQEKCMENIEENVYADIWASRVNGSFGQSCSKANLH